MLLLIVGLGAVEGHHGHGAHRPGGLVLPPGEGGVIKLGAPPRQRLEGIAAIGDQLGLGGVHRLYRAGPLFSNAGELVTGYHRSLGIDDADGAVGAVLHLQNHALENPAGHRALPPSLSALRRWISLTAEPALLPAPSFLLYWFFSPFSIGKLQFFVKNAEEVRDRSKRAVQSAFGPPSSSARAARSPSVRGRHVPGSRAGSKAMGPMDSRLR